MDATFDTIANHAGGNMPRPVTRAVTRLARNAVLVLLAVVVVVAGALLAVPQWRAAVLPAADGTGPAGPPFGYREPATAGPPELPLDALAEAPAPTAKALLGRLPKLAAKVAGTSSVLVLDPQTGRTLINRGNRPAIPASTMKLLSSLVALETLGERRSFATTVLSPRRGVLILRGGGDPLLTDARTPGRASLQDLAAAAAAGLRRDGVGKVTIGYDAGLFTGRAWHPRWTDNYRYSVAPISALTVNRGRDRTGKADDNPARTAAKAFAARLAKAGIVVGAVKPMKAASDDDQLASVSSPDVADIVEHNLRYSDNTGVETLTRQVGLIARRGGDFAGGTRAVRETLKRLGLWAPGMVVDDSCGLSRNNRVTPVVLAKAMQLVVTENRFRALLPGLPVGGVSGTLTDRFDDAGERAGRGIVRAKTGSLRDVTTLAGYLVTADGSPLIFVLMANRVSRPVAVRDWMDTATARWAACGCG